MLLSVGFASSTATVWPSLGFRVNRLQSSQRFHQEGAEHSCFPLLADIPPGSSDSPFTRSGSCLEVRDAAGCPALSRGGKPGLELFAPNRGFSIRAWPAVWYLTPSLFCPPPSTEFETKWEKTGAGFHLEAVGRGG